METIKITLELTKEEASYLTIEMNCILRQFGLTPYAGRQFTNPDMANAFNKVFKALTGENHPNCEPNNFKEIENYHNEIVGKTRGR